MITVENNLRYLEIHLEHDSGYPKDWRQFPDKPEYKGLLASVVNQMIIINGIVEQPMPGAWYLSVDCEYQWNMSPGQRKLFEILRIMQKGSTYSITTIGQLSESMELLIPFSTEKRLYNLQTIGAIEGIPKGMD